MENPIKIDSLGVPLFLETPIYPYRSNPLLRMVMEPQYYAEKVIGHPNHQSQAENMTGCLGYSCSVVFQIIPKCHSPQGFLQTEDEIIPRHRTKQQPTVHG